MVKTYKCDKKEYLTKCDKNTKKGCFGCKDLKEVILKDK